MRDYGKVHTSFWTSAGMRALSEDGRAMALYLLTCPHGTIAGVFRLPDGYICEDMQWTAERVTHVFAELFQNGFANRCATTKWVWINKHFEWNQPENPNQRKAALKIANQVPDECSWRLDFMRLCGEFLGLPKASEANPSPTVQEPFLNQEQEQEQEQEQSNAPSPKSPRGTALRADWILPNDWKTWATKERGDLDVEVVADSFRDYWVAKPGKDGRKSDWQATWRNWVRNQRGGGQPRKPQGGAMGTFV
ncbi:hypothetical protein [Comamonas sp. JUb58]|uniref:hypothetical protein n=1 Tax=Comamonas sp. JUb58 TaxID=2485114 RepID=UPI00105C7D5B|nr:hypothetical protein [Comamonas sp. JUb58]TDS73419.1 hypothetical protein EDF71_12193 [Comamonas sp. JUb58]